MNVKPHDLTAVSSTKLRSTVLEKMVAAVERAELRHQPCDHIVMDHIFDPATYANMLAVLPEARFYHDLMHPDAIRADGRTSTRQRIYLYPEVLRRLPKDQRHFWLPIGQALCSKPLERAFKTKFRDALEGRFGKPIDKISLYPVPILLRDQPGYTISVHADTLTKAITVQYYLPPDDRQKHLGTLFHEANTGPGLNKTVQMPFLPSTGYAFPVVGKKSWHSANRTTETDGERVTMMVTYYVTERPYDWLRHRLRHVMLAIGLHPQR
jgi:hypothetical protein